MFKAELSGSIECVTSLNLGVYMDFMGCKLILRVPVCLTVTAVTVTDTLRVIFVFALLVPGSEGLGLGLPKNNHRQVCGVEEHLPLFRRCDKSRLR